MDGLSNLPDALLCHILSFMPIQDVVRTTVLSKRWQSLWISVPNLYFDMYSRNSYSNHHFIHFVNRALLFRGGNKIRRFKIELFLSRDYQRDLDLWVRYALQNDVEEVFLDLVGDHISYELPQVLYSCSSVKIMRLSMCSIPYDGQISWPSLNTLTLSHVCLFREVLQKVLLGSPNLECLKVSYCSGFNGLRTNSTRLKKLMMTLRSPSLGMDLEPVLSISAPNVTSLHLSGFLYRRCLLTDMCSLEHATVNFSAKLYDVERFDGHQDMLLQVLASIDRVKNLTLGSWCIKLLYCSELGRLAGFCNFGGDNYMTSQVNTMNGLLPPLKVVNITNFVDQKSLFLLIELLLKKAKVLERMAIRPKKAASSSSESLLHAALKLLAMPRLSPGAVVTFLN